MKIFKIIFGLIILIISTAPISYTQQQFMHTTTIRSPADVDPSDPACNCVASLPPNGNAGGDLSGTYPNPTVQKLLGRPMSNLVPKIGQILKWNGTEWIPVEDDLVATTLNVSKLSVLYFNQTGMVNMYDPTVNLLKPIVGLNDQTFILTKNSRVVFYSTIEAKIFADSQNALDTYGISQATATGVEFTAELLNSANSVVARSSSVGWLTRDTPQTVVSTGIGLLPAGTYRTKVTIKKQAGGARLDVAIASLSSGKQGGQMILEIFPE